jgi:hypothetical protein
MPYPVHNVLLLYHVLLQVLRTVTHDKATGHELAVNEFTTFILGTGGCALCGATRSLYCVSRCKCSKCAVLCLSALRVEAVVVW